MQINPIKPNPDQFAPIIPKYPIPKGIRLFRKKDDEASLSIYFDIENLSDLNASANEFMYLIVENDYIFDNGDKMNAGVYVSEESDGEIYWKPIEEKLNELRDIESFYTMYNVDIPK